MSTHVVYKIIDPRVPMGKYSRVLYVGSGLPSRPNTSLRNSHVQYIRENSSSLGLVVSSRMPEAKARATEVRLIQKYQPVFNTVSKRTLAERLLPVNDYKKLADMVNTGLLSGGHIPLDNWWAYATIKEIKKLRDEEGPYSSLVSKWLVPEKLSEKEQKAYGPVRWRNNEERLRKSVTAKLSPLKVALLNEHFLDLRLPLSFYVALDNSRAAACCRTQKESNLIACWLVYPDGSIDELLELYKKLDVIALPRIIETRKVLFS